MNRFFSFVALGAILLSGCGKPHGQPERKAEELAPAEVLDFASNGPLSEIPKQGTISSISVHAADGIAQIGK